MWVEFVVGSLPCHEGFSPGTPVFPSPQKLAFPNSNLTRNLWVEFVVGSLPCHEGFSPGTPVFPSPQKLTFPNSNSTRNQVDKEAQCGCATFKSLFIYLLRGYLIIFVFRMSFQLETFVIFSNGQYQCAIRRVSQ